MPRTSSHSLTKIGTLLFAALQPLQTSPLPIAALPAAEVSYQPSERSEYTQAWNYNFHGGGVSIYATIVISNLGPGSLNNGVSILVHENGRDHIQTAEYNDELLQARPGQFGAKVYTSEIALHNGQYILTVRLDGLEADVQMPAAGAALRLSGGPIASSGDGGFIRADIPAAGGPARARLKIGNQERILQGVAGLEALYATSSPHHYARSLKLTRTFQVNRGLFLAHMRVSDDVAAGDFISYARIDGAIRGEDRLRLTASEERLNAFSNYRIATQSEYRSPEGCTIREELGAPLGQYYILQHVSALLRWVIRTFFTRPYILYFKSRISLQCGARTESFDGYTSIYLINY
ncbi:MAG: hypothetical protein K1X75_08825 [Leptospirales bacterium]|nr:hypothetical protein [Leptospirales bacterium]